MRCADAANLLSRLEPRPGEVTAADLGTKQRPLLDEAIERGWAVRVDEPRIDRAALGSAREALAAVRARRTAGEGGPALETEERRLREEVLALSAKLARFEGSVALGGAGGPYRDAPGGDGSLGRLALTVRGRALLADIAPRLAHAGDTTVEAFEEDMRMLRATISARAKRAAEILRLMSPAFPTVDEIHLRAAAVGLAVRRERPEKVARAFTIAMRGLLSTPLPDDKESVAAEGAVVMAPSLDDFEGTAASFVLRTFDALRNRPACTSMADAANSAMIMVVLPASEQGRAIDEASALLAAMPAPTWAGARDLAPAMHLVVAGMGTDPSLPSRLAEAESSVRALTGGNPQSLAAAALLVSARVDLASALDRFGTLLQILGRFSPTGLVVPAALLALIEATPAEVLDNLRLAGAAITENKLALGGMENMSLAVKLLVEVGILAAGTEGDPEEQLDLAPKTVPALAAMGTVGLSVALPMAIAAVSTFHQTTIHRMAVSDFGYHPAHSHYVYG